MTQHSDPISAGHSAGMLRMALLTMFLAIIICSCSHIAYAKPRQILFLNSYHAGYKWSDEEYAGFLDSLQPVLGEISLHVEYLDMKRNYAEERYARLAESLAIKYENTPIDLLVSSDDAAFLFLQRHGNTLFPGVPVFFCGTNYLQPDDLLESPNFYGIIEQADIEATFKTILELLPDTKHIYIINDQTVTGQKVHGQIVQAIARYRNRVDFTIWEDISMPDLITNVNSLSDNSVIFYTFFFRDSTGRPFKYNQSISLLYRQSPVPIFGAWDFNLGLGLAGGMLISGYQQGKAVAELVLSWLNNTPVTDMPRITSSPNRYMFDYRQLKKFGISPRALPPDSIVINRPVSFVQTHKQVLITSGLFISLLLLVIAALTFNIFRRKKAEMELRQSEENFRAIFDNANDGLYQATADGRFIRVNPALASMLKFSTPREVIDHFTDIDNQLYTSPGTRGNVRNRHKNIGWAKGEHSLYCRDGSVINVIENTHTVTDEHGRFLYYEGSITDITEYKKIQELIAQTEKIISLGGVSAGIAHEIRSPLSSIVQGIQFVRSRIYDDTTPNLQTAKECGFPLDTFRQYLEKRDVDDMLTNIYESGKRVGRIIEDMLSFSKETIGDFSLESLEDILDVALELARKDYSLTTEYNFRDITIIREYEQAIPKVLCSASKIQQVFFNILKNGAEAMGEAGTVSPRFTLRIGRSNNSARVEVEDNGPGMDRELQQRIFDPFFTTKGRKKGTGLGLSVSYFIIRENHHGDLRVRSQPGKGTTFILELPFEQAAPADASGHYSDEKPSP